MAGRAKKGSAKRGGAKKGGAKRGGAKGGKYVTRSEFSKFRGLVMSKFGRTDAFLNELTNRVRQGAGLKRLHNPVASSKPPRALMSTTRTKKRAKKGKRGRKGVVQQKRTYSQEEVFAA